MQTLKEILIGALAGLAIVTAVCAFVFLTLLAIAEAGYERSDWPHWSDADGDCMNTRHEVLAEESLVPPTLSPDGCRVVWGLWHDWYTGLRFQDPALLDVDHLVPLYEAHRSGGAEWDRETKRAYANDMRFKDHLVAVQTRANRQKRAKDPARWLPPEGKCRYIWAWVAVKTTWRLSMDREERRAIVNALDNCLEKHQ